jgi:H+/Cl- antiporter ClcA
VALGLYAVLAVLVWLTMGGGKVLVELPWFDLSEYRFIVVSKPVEMRLIPLIFISGFVLRTVLTRQAEKIRRSGEKDSF